MSIIHSFCRIADSAAPGFKEMMTTAADETVFAGIELGGTKAIAVIASGGRIIGQHAHPTTTPEATIGAMLADLRGWQADYRLAAIGVAAFGPLMLDPAAADFGHVLPTTKPHWSGFDLLGTIRAGIDLPIALETDVNAAALAEERWGGSAGCAVHAYVTVGTGIGVGIVANGAPVHGAMHPEMGHIRVRRVPGDDFAGVCPFHGDCIEGLASGPAIAARTGLAGAAIADDHPVWTTIAAEMGDFFSTLLLTLAPQRVAIGGGVLTDRPTIIEAIRRATADRLGGYLITTDRPPEQRIVRASLGADAGPMGAIALAMQALKGDGGRE